MKLKPAITGPGPLYPTLMALAGAAPSGCGKQQVPGGSQSPAPTEESLKTGGKPSPHPGTPGGEQ